MHVSDSIDQDSKQTKSNFSFLSSVWNYIDQTLFFRLFVRARFFIHRFVGLLYLILYLAATISYFVNYAYFKTSSLIWALPLTGVLQTIVAIRTFTFLPKTKKDPGYYGDKGALTYPFICENLFFSSLLLFQWLYYSDKFYPIIKKYYLIEWAFVFLPYLFRPLFPKTSFRDSINNYGGKSDKNRQFFLIMTYITKVFYIWAKHYIGFFLNYVRFFDLVSPDMQYHVYFLLICSAFATTISMFLHTLKFKGYLGPKKAMGIYVISYMMTFISFINIFPVFYNNLYLTLITFVGIILNLCGTRYHDIYQLILLGIFVYLR